MHEVCSTNLRLPGVNDTEAFFSFISEHHGDDPARLRLKYAGRPLPFDLGFALTQIEVRTRNRAKLAPLLREPEFVVPSRLAAEQATLPALADWHASLAAGSRRVLDMTCGLGVDAMAMARAGAQVTAFDTDPLKTACTRWNASVFGLHGLAAKTGDSVRWLESEGASAEFDTIFVDPARRDGVRRLYALSDCEPDISGIIGELLHHAPHLLIKASPMLDVAATLRELPRVKRLFAVSVKGECKELLISCEREFEGHPDIAALILNDTTGETSTIALDSSLTRAIEYAHPDGLAGARYLYEPDAAVMKIAPWAEIQTRFPGLLKLDPNTHLFVSTDLQADFPGRICEIDDMGSMRDFSKRHRGTRASAVSRNSPVDSETLKKRLRLTDDDNAFVYCCRIGSETRLFHARRTPPRAF